MSALAQMQARFFAGLLVPTEAPVDAVRSSTTFSADQRLAVYANAYRQRLVEALGSVFERCREVLGEDVFDSLALAYVESHPPTDRALRWYGDDFPEWLGAEPDCPPFAGDLATIDRGLRRAFDAADFDPVPRDDLLALTLAQWTQLRIEWHPALSIGLADPRGLALWQREVHSSLDTSVAPPPVSVAFWRNDGLTRFRSLSTAESMLVQRMRNGSTFADACLDPTSPMAIDVAAAALLGWVNDGWIATIRFDDACDALTESAARDPA